MELDRSRRFVEAMGRDVLRSPSTPRGEGAKALPGWWLTAMLERGGPGLEVWTLRRV